MNSIAPNSAKPKPTAKKAKASSAPAKKPQVPVARKRKPAAPCVHAVVFEYQGQPGQSVAVAGSFNAWDIAKNAMAEVGAGHYACTLELAPGTYEYKFVVDSLWMMDPNNANFTPNAHGSLNSVLVVE